MLRVRGGRGVVILSISRCCKNVERQLLQVKNVEMIFCGFGYEFLVYEKFSIVYEGIEGGDKDYGG